MMGNFRCLAFGLALVATAGCDQPDPDAINILALNKVSGTGVEAEIETLVDGERTNLTLIELQFQFLIDLGEEPTSWTTTTSDWLPGDQGVRLVSAGLDADAVGVDQLQTFDRVVITARAWEGNSEVVEQEQTFYFWQDAFQIEKPVQLSFDLDELPVGDTGQPSILNNAPAVAPIRLELSSARRVRTVGSLELLSWEGANVQAWFGDTTSATIEEIAIATGDTTSPDFLITGPLLPGFSQSIHGPQWDGTTDELGQGSVITIRGDAMINGELAVASGKLPLVDSL